MLLRFVQNFQSQTIRYGMLNKCMHQQRNVSYIQGQEPEPKIREYFYYINHEGMLFLDDAKMKNFTSCFKDKQFLKFFFTRLKFNDSGRYQKDFPFLSLCGRERNFIRCDDLPIVFTHIIKSDSLDLLTYAYAGDLLTVPFEVNKIYMSNESGRVYHPAGERFGGIGLIRSKLAIELSKGFHFEKSTEIPMDDQQPPSHFTWNNIKYELDKNWLNSVKVKRY